MEDLAVFSQNPLACNTYIYIQGKNALVVESSGQISQIIDVLKKHHIEHVILAYTHGHFDHIAYGAHFQEKLAEAGLSYKTFAPHAERDYFEEAGQEILEQSLQIFSVSDMYPQAKIPKIDVYLEEGNPLPFLDFVTLETPGHSPGSCCFYSAEKKIMFSGDTIFADGGTGRTDLPGGSSKQLVNSLTKLSSLPHEICIYPGHGLSDLLGRSIKLAL